MSEVVGKVCCHCKVEKPHSCFHHNKNILDGYSIHCKQCVREFRKHCMTTHPLPEKKIVIGYKICSVCKIEKPYSDFYKNNRNKDNFDYLCKSCFLIRNNQNSLKRKIRWETKNKQTQLTAKICPKCKGEKQYSDFQKNKASYDGYFRICKQCSREYQKDQREKRYPKKLPNGMKICNTCKIEKPYSDFYKSKSHSYGCMGRCKVCDAKYSKQRLIGKKDQKREYNQKYFLANKDELKVSNKKWRDQNKDHIRLYRFANIDKINEQRRKAHERNKEKNNEKSREWGHTHKKEIALYMRERKKRDPTYRIKCNTSSAIRQALIRNGSSKNGVSAFRTVGYTPKKLKEHLEGLFINGQTWENYGKEWQIHHVVPQAYFKFTSMDDPQFKICWDLYNLMPLDKKTNNKLGHLVRLNRITKEHHIEESLKHLPLNKKEQFLCH